MEQQRQKLEASEDESVKMVCSWTNTDTELVYTLFEKYRIEKGDPIKVDSYAQTQPINLNQLAASSGKEDEKIWNEVELVSQQQIYYNIPTEYEV